MCIRDRCSAVLSYAEDGPFQLPHDVVGDVGAVHHLLSPLQETVECAARYAGAAHELNTGFIKGRGCLCGIPFLYNVEASDKACALARHELDHDGFLRVQAVFRLVVDLRSMCGKDLCRDLLAAMGGQTVLHLSLIHI